MEGLSVPSLSSGTVSLSWRGAPCSPPGSGTHPAKPSVPCQAGGTLQSDTPAPPAHSLCPSPPRWPQGCAEPHNPQPGSHKMSQGCLSAAALRAQRGVPRGWGDASTPCPLLAPGQRPLEGAGQHGRRERSGLNWEKPLGEVQQQSPAELSPAQTLPSAEGTAALPAYLRSLGRASWCLQAI